MKTLLFYFLQVVLASGVLYAYYHFFLRNSRFHQYNRFYLLAASLLSLVVPLLRFDIYFNSPEEIPAVYQLLTEFRTGNTGTTNNTPSFFTGTRIIQFCYWMVVVLLFTRFCVALWKIKRLKSDHRVEKLQHISFINTRENGTPFSFFRWLFWNEKINIESPGGQTIFRHELFHIRQKHSWDIIYLELLAAICWINPFFHLIKKETRTIHEFLADQYAAGTENKTDYAELLLMQALQTRQRLINPFFHNQVKRRIAMIMHSPQPNYQYLRKIMVLPVTLLLVAIIAFNCTSKEADKTPPVDEDAQKTKIEPLNNVEENAVKVTPDDELADYVKGKEVEKGNKIFSKVEIEPTFRGGAENWRQFLSKNLNANVPVDNGAPEGTYKVKLQFVVDVNGKLSELKAMTNLGYGMEQEVLRVMKLSPDWLPAIRNGKIVKAYKVLPVTFVVTEE